LSTLRQAALSTIAEKRGSQPRRLSQQLHGELDWIVMKALEKDRNRRYESASALAADLRRYLDDEPVLACPPSLAYRLRKYGRRNRTMLTTAVVVATALILGTILSVLQAFEATNARKLADERLTLADERLVLADDRLENEKQARADADLQRMQASTNLQKALDAVDQMLTRIADEKLRDIPRMEPIQMAIFDDALKFYQGFLDEKGTDPIVRHRVARALHRMAWSLNDIPDRNDPGKELRFRAEALRLLQELHEEFPQNSLYQFELATELITYLCFKPIGPETEDGFWRAIQLLEPLAANPGPDLTLESALAADRRNLFAVVPVDVKQRNRRDSVRQVILCCLANAYHSLGWFYLQAVGRSDEAEEMVRKAIAIAEGAPGWNQQVLSWCYRDLSGLYDGRGRLDDALRAIDKGLAYRRGILRDYPDGLEFRHLYFVYLQHRGGLLLKAHRPEEAAVAFRTALDAAVRFAEDFPSIHFSKGNWHESQSALIAVLESLGRGEEAREILDQAIESGRGDMRTYRDRGALCATMGQFAQARQDFDSAVAAGNAKGDVGWYERYQRALCYLHDGDQVAYQTAAAEILERFKASEDPSELRWTVWTCVLAPRGLDNYGPLVELARRVHDLQPTDLSTTMALGAALFRAGDFELALGSLSSFETTSTNPNTTPLYAWYFLAMTYHKLGHDVDARQWFDRAEAETTRMLADGKTESAEPLPWNRRLTLELLRAETRAMLAGTQPGPPEERAGEPGSEPVEAPRKSDTSGIQGSADRGR
ncbi:MAG: tetratricopeptide repeat protein, partial [Pirellulales bacterium]